MDGRRSAAGGLSACRNCFRTAFRMVKAAARAEKISQIPLCPNRHLGRCMFPGNGAFGSNELMPADQVGRGGRATEENEFVDNDGTLIGKVCVECLRRYSEVTCVYPSCRVTGTFSSRTFRKVSYLTAGHVS